MREELDSGKVIIGLSAWDEFRRFVSHRQLSDNITSS